MDEPKPIAHLADVLPAAAAALGVDIDTGRRPALQVPAANRIVVMLVDGLGDLLLAAHRSHAPVLSGLRRPTDPIVVAGHPSTTATSMGSFGTGRLPGTHGLVGYEVLDPGTGRVFNELSWQDGPVPTDWQPHRTVFEQVRDAGADVFHVGPAFFEGSGLTTAALRGPLFVPAGSLPDRVDATVSILRQSPRCLVYLYWGEVDKAGHEFGVASERWVGELEAVELAVRTLIARLPRDAVLVITADHGMVDVPLTARIDLGDDSPRSRAMGEGVRLVGGEPRAPMLYTDPDAAPRVRDRWRQELGPEAIVLLRDEAVAAGWFGPVEPRVIDRIGDVVVALGAAASVHDSRVQHPRLIELIGMHGSLTPDERRIPFLVHAPGAGRA